MLAGGIDILAYIQERIGTTRFHTVMGGTHLGAAGEEQAAQTITTLRQFNIARLAMSHCTDPRVAALLDQVCARRPADAQRR